MKKEELVATILFESKYIKHYGARESALIETKAKEMSDEKAKRLEDFLKHHHSRFDLDCCVYDLFNDEDK